MSLEAWREAEIVVDGFDASRASNVTRIGVRDYLSRARQYLKPQASSLPGGEPERKSLALTRDPGPNPDPGMVG